MKKLLNRRAITGEVERFVRRWERQGEFPEEFVFDKRNGKIVGKYTGVISFIRTSKGDFDLHPVYKEMGIYTPEEASGPLKVVRKYTPKPTRGDKGVLCFDAFRVETPSGVIKWVSSKFYGTDKIWNYPGFDEVIMEISEAVVSKPPISGTRRFSIPGRVNPVVYDFQYLTQIPPGSGEDGDGESR